MRPAAVFHGIACCVTHLYVWKIWQQGEEATGIEVSKDDVEFAVNGLLNFDLFT